MLPFFHCWLTACVTRAGADGRTLSDEKKAEAEKMPENAQTPQRRVHALLGSFSKGCKHSKLPIII